MRIGIDARLIDETGVGRYIRNLMAQLASLDSTHEFVVFLRKRQFDTYTLPNVRWSKVLADAPWHSLTEQIVMPAIFLQANLDLLHVPYFNVPLLYPGRMVVTIHDLTILHIDTGRATTLPWILYKLKRLGYRMLVWWAVHRSGQLIAVSETTKQDIVKSFGIDPARIHVTYEGVSLQPSKEKPLISEPYFLYVGNAYPHKNVEILIEAAAKANVRVVYVGKNDFFYKRLGITPKTVSDDELANLYMYAKALVFPSRMEGFGLPAIEALSLGCPVICSDIPIFHEILGENAVYFDPANASELAALLQGNIVKKKWKSNAFRWETMARKTADVYESSVGI